MKICRQYPLPPLIPPDCLQEGHLKDVKYLMRAKAPLAESAGKLIKLLDELIIDLNQPLLELPQKNITELDKKLYALRDDEMVGFVAYTILYDSIIWSIDVVQPS